MKSIKGLLALILSFEVALAPTTLYAQSSKAPLPETITREQAQLAYWAGLDLNQPHVADFALGDTEKDKPLWVVNDDSALLDEDPFFMRAQAWEPAAKIEDCADQICFRKDKDGLVLGNSNFEKTLRLQERFTPVLETEEYLILAADDDRIFREKNPGTADPGEGVFFLHKRDLVTGAATGFPVPIFFFPLPDAGWTGNNGGAFEFAAVDQFVLTDKSGFAFPIDRRDFLEVENSGRRNLILAQAYSFLEGRIRADGVAFPRPNSTILFGTLPSGIMPKPRAGLTGRIDVEKIRRIGNELNPLASAHAEMSEATRLQILREEIERQASGRSALRKWISPIVLYGGTFLAAAGLYSSYPIDWSAMITDDMPAKLTKLAGVLAVVTAVSVGLRVTLHKAQLDKKYAHAKTTLQKVDFYHRSLLDELVHGLYTSFAMIGQTLRHIMEFTKDRTLPSSHLLHKAWDETMGFQMKQNSHLAMNWKTFYLGALWFGMADTFLVAVDLLIFTPAIIDYFSLGMATTAAAASFASAEVLRNFLGYIQTGAHGYSAEVKFIHLSAATEEAKRQLLLMHKNPEAKENEVELQELTENNLARRYKAVGLPDQDEFLYDPLSILEWITKTAGFGIDGKLSPGQRELLKEHRFVMARRRFGFSQPSLKRAVKMAERILRQAPSPDGARVVQTLKWAAKDRSAVKATLGHNMDLLATGRFMDYPKSLYGDVTAALAEDDLTNRFQLEMNWWQRFKTQTKKDIVALKSATESTWKFFVSDGVKEVRDKRRMLYLASTNGATQQLSEFIPESWREKAGTEKAAEASLEILSRSFRSYYEEDKDLVETTADVEERFGARAEAIVSEQVAADDTLNDPFLRELRKEEVMEDLNAAEYNREQIVSWKPGDLSGLAGNQWRQALARAEKILASEPVDELVAQRWKTLAERFTENTGRPVDPESFSKTYRYRLTMAREFARTIGLEVNGVEDSQFVRDVMIEAVKAAESELALPNARKWISNLNESDREFFEARVFTQNFIQTYVAMSVASEDHMLWNSTEYPGRFQKFRKKLVSWGAGQAALKTVRVFEALWRNEDTSYRPGFWSYVDRNVPLIPDLYHNFVRTLRIMPWMLSLGYLVSYHVWQIHMPYALWGFMMLSQFAGMAIIELNNRVQKNIGNKPMGSIPDKLKYSFWHSRLTNPEIMLIQAYAEPIVDTVDTYAVKPAKKIVGECVDFLDGDSGKHLMRVN